MPAPPRRATADSTAAPVPPQSAPHPMAYLVHGGDLNPLLSAWPAAAPTPDQMSALWRLSTASVAAQPPSPGLAKSVGTAFDV